MDFLSYTIPPQGRNKYGNYVSSTNTTRMVTRTVYAGNDTTTTLDVKKEIPASSKYTNYPYTSGGTWWVGETNTGIGYVDGDVINIVNNHWFINGTDTGINVEYVDAVSKNWVLFLDKTSDTVEDTGLTSVVIKTVSPVGYAGTVKGPVYIGNLSGTGPYGSWDGTGTPAWDSNYQYGITGLTTGVEVSVIDNGTTGTSIQFYFNSSLTDTEGTIQIPCNLYLGTEDTMGEDWYKWVENGQDAQQAVLTWSWTLITTEVASIYRLSLSNDNASIVANSDGTIPSGAYLPTCEARLYYGSEQVTSVTYSLDTSCAITGMTSSVTDGVLSISFQHPVTFADDAISITVSASTANELVDIKVFSISKAKAGADGTSPTIYWLEPSYSSIIYDPDTSAATPSVLNATGWTQTGTETPEAVTLTQSIYITYQMEPLSAPGTWTTEIWLPSTGLTITSAMCLSYNRIRLLFQNDDEQLTMDMEDIEILRNGSAGSSGRTGAAIRGPYNYEDVSATTRIWCNGEESTAFPESSKWLDVLIKDGVYYYCNTPFQSNLTSWDYVSQWFTSGDSFDFVATNLLMADNAKIEFLTGNEIYLGTSSSAITAGIAGGSGSTYAFWAGNSEAEPNFYVDHDGNIMASKGTFKGNVYIPFTDLTEITKTGSYYYAGDEAHILKDYSDGGKLRLPTPSSAYNGFVYEILATPPLSQATALQVGTVGNYEIFDFTATTLGSATGKYSATLNWGNFKFVCLYYGGVYRWALIDASPNASYSFSSSTI